MQSNMNDGWEVYYGLDPLSNDAATQSDSDGLSNLIESMLGTDPFNIDTDGDTISDGMEDADKDGIIDMDETNPLCLDSDFDYFPDNLDNHPTIFNINGNDINFDEISVFKENNVHLASVAIKYLGSEHPSQSTISIVKQEGINIGIQIEIQTSYSDKYLGAVLIRYDEPLPSDIRENTLAIYQLVDEHWELIDHDSDSENSIVDTNNNFVWAILHNFGTFRIKSIGGQGGELDDADTDNDKIADEDEMIKNAYWIIPRANNKNVIIDGVAFDFNVPAVDVSSSWGSVVKDIKPGDQPIVGSRKDIDSTIINLKLGGGLYQSGDIPYGVYRIYVKARMISEEFNDFQESNKGLMKVTYAPSYESEQAKQVTCQEEFYLDSNYEWYSTSNVLIVDGYIYIHISDEFFVYGRWATSVYVEKILLVGADTNLEDGLRIRHGYLTYFKDPDMDDDGYPDGWEEGENNYVNSDAVWIEAEHMGGILTRKNLEQIGIFSLSEARNGKAIKKSGWWDSISDLPDGTYDIYIRLILDADNTFDLTINAPGNKEWSSKGPFPIIR